jgi:hypothetical protein
MLQDNRGRSFLTTVDYVRTGFPMALMILVAVQTIGYFYMGLLGW